MYAATNYALGKPAFQSSNHLKYPTAKRAVDGNSYSNLERGKSCTLTNSELNPWWAVDLRMVVRIEEVVVTNRKLFEGTKMRTMET